MRDIELSDALERLVTIMENGLANGTIQIEGSIRQELLDWYTSQPAFIRSLCGKHMADVGLLVSLEHKEAELSSVAL